MAWFDRAPGEKKNPSEVPAPPPLSPAKSGEEVPAESAAEELVAYLYKGSRVTGQLTFHGPGRIDGSVDGEVLCHGVLTIGEEAEVRARISGDVVIIRGKVEGDVAAKEKIELETPARLLGNIDAPRVTITEGVVFDGRCSMGGARDRREPLSPARSGSEKALEAETPKLIGELDK
ncbi:MAG: polymer-forming cytoskeletal protein [Deltaproteobacteria bacterium]|nr:polymer-forming cytoskeletal protein [Deltaproteobacteria bacterium]MBI3062543.1 polymer-forming cytoskeletal protein [Deltaproteobacteria bacterium]